MLVEGAADAKARRALLDQQHRQPLRRPRLRIGDGRNAVEIGMDAVGDEHLGAVEHIAVAIPARGGPDALHIRARARLGDADRDDFLAGDDVRHEAVLQRLRTAVEQMHRRHVGMNQHRDGDAGKRRSAQLFGQHHRRQRIQIGAAIFRRITDAEKAEFAHPAQHLARHHAFLFPGRRVRLDLLIDEAPDLGAQQFVLFPR